LKRKYAVTAISRNDTTIVSWPRGSMLFQVSLTLAILGI
jgi:hypothetical protein